MKLHTLPLVLFLFVVCLPAEAQEFDISRITVINLGDGRMLHRTMDGEQTLSGQHRIIDGRRSEYVEATFADGLYHGSYERHRNNKLAEKGSYKEGRRDGAWIEYFSDGVSVKSERHFKEGKLDGIQKTFFTDGKTESEKGYKEGVEHGPERKWDYQTGKQIVDANFRDGRPDGKQTRFITSNTGNYVQVSNYADGVQSGDYSETWADGVVRTSGIYKDDKKEGKWIENNRDGKPRSESTYKGGELNGESRTFFTDGTIDKITNYRSGVREGVSQEFYYDSGKLKNEYTYADNWKEGAYKIFYDNGTLREEGRCERGNEIYQREYYYDGKLKQVRERNSRGQWEILEKYDSHGNKL